MAFVTLKGVDRRLIKEQGRTPPSAMDERIEALNIAAGRQFYTPLDTPAVSMRRKIYRWV